MGASDGISAAENSSGSLGGVNFIVLVISSVSWESKLLLLFSFFGGSGFCGFGGAQTASRFRQFSIFGKFSGSK